MKSIYIISFFITISHFVFGQMVLPSYQADKVRRGFWYVRWEPRSAEEWHTSLQGGYDLKVYRGDKNANNYSLFKEENLKASSAESWDRAAENYVDTVMQSHYKSAKLSIYTSDEVKQGVQDMLEKEEGKTKEQSADEFRYGMLVYGATSLFDVLKMSGLGYRIKIEDQYDYKIVVETKGFDPYEFELEKKPDPQVPQLKSDFRDKKVILKWKTQPYKNDFFGYFIEKSEDGKNYNLTSDVPYMEYLEREGLSEKFQYREEEFKLDKNYKEYYYRISGMDYFGFTSKKKTVASGYGYDRIRTTPVVSLAEQTEDNKARIEWKVDAKFNRLIRSYEIEWSNTRTGEYKPVLSNLPVSTRKVEIPMDTIQNFYKIVMHPKDGGAIRSFPVFVMGMDTIAPITPLNFTGIIDSSGIVTLKWNANTEQDLWGYKIFRSEFKEDEFSPLNVSPTMDTVFIDSVRVRSFNEEIHYTILAADTRNNRSEFAEILTLKRPDIIPPVPPFIKKITFSTDTITVPWDRSSSLDVIRHKLFRKNIHEDDSWTLVSTFGKGQSVNVWYDTHVLPDSKYAYLMVALDDDGLESEPSILQTVSTKIKKNRTTEAFETIDVAVDEESKEATISWNLKDEEGLAQITIYRGRSKDRISLYKIVQPYPNSFTEEKLKPGSTLYFYLKPDYVGGKKGKMSELIEVQY